MAVEAGAVAEKPAALPPKPSGAELAVVESPRPLDERWKPVLGLPCELSVDLPLPSFRIADLLQLRVGSLINTGWHLGHDVPLRINGTLMGWSEFEVVNERLAVRLTELA
jgi:flagellar motor switch/type III secretory pathway protein FliN